VTPSLRRALLGAAVAIPSVAYLATAARDVLGGDNGELATIAVTGGAAHPPGYPIVAAYLHAMQWLPGASPAQSAALANALVGCAAASMLVRACLAWGASTAATAVVVVVAALAPTTWALASQAEVFTLGSFFAASILWLGAPAAPLRPPERVVALAFVAGLALANHYTVGALAPLGLLATGRALRDSGRRPLVVAAGAAALLLGLAPYALLFGASGLGSDPATWSWGDVHDARTLLAYLRRDEYADLRMASLDHVAAELIRVTVGLLGLPAVAAAALVKGLFTREGPPGGPDRARTATWLALAASIALAGPVFAAIFAKPLEGPGIAVLERFDVLPMTLLAPACACALDVLAARALSRPAVAVAALATAAAVGVGVGLPTVRARHRPTVELYVRNALLVAPPGAIVVGSGDQRLGGFLYARYALGLRPDVVFVNPRMLFEPWYLERIERAIGATLPPPRDRELDVVATLATLLATGRPVLVADLFSPSAIARFPSYPLGPLIRLVPSLSDVPPPDRVLEENEAVAARFAREPLPVPGPDPWGDALLPDYARPWTSLADLYARANDPGRAAALRLRAERAGAGAPP
jgi:hypothetical protein